MAGVEIGLDEFDLWVTAAEYFYDVIGVAPADGFGQLGDGAAVAVDDAEADDVVAELGFDFVGWQHVAG
jgi:hypothetical protein